MLRKKERFLCGVVEGFYGRPWTTSQRVDLFTRMSEWSMNAYLYAPKDDVKHRACWRELYSLEEANQLSHLIHEATSKGVIFIYAIAPGLDITFSSTKEVELLKRKLDQVSALGCNSFALLFDDIDSDMCPADAKVFPSFAHAQVATTNELYSHLDQPNVFLFCPTEYCATRSIPSVMQSQYLKHVGAELDPNIDVLWTGPKVISKSISLPSIKELSAVLQRPPVIWDNLHANDYDQRRLFLGPYCGRSVTLHAHMNGVLTNPNCEYTANYVAIHTLAQWSRSAAELAKRPSPTRQAIQLEVEGQTNELNTFDDCEGSASWESDTETKRGERLGRDLELHLYEPIKALEVALKEWISEFTTSLRQPDQYLPVKNASSIAKANEFEELSQIDQVGIVDPDALHSKPVDPEVDPKLSESGGAMLVVSDPFSYDDLKVLVDFFYLPHQHGERAMKVLEEFCWLKESAPGYEALQSMGKLKGEGEGRDREGGGRCDRVQKDGMRSDGETSDPTEEELASAQEVTEWCERCLEFHSLCQVIKDMYGRLTAIPNRPLLYDVYQYMWDAKETTQLLDSYISCLESGGNEVNSSHEPLLPYGGITAEMQGLLPQVKKSGSLYRGGRPPREPCAETFTVRPYNSDDNELVYQVCLETGDSGDDATNLFSNYSDLLGDRFVGPYVVLSPELSFVLEDSRGVCGYVLAALDSRGFYDRFTNDWLPQLAGKYPPRPSSSPSHKDSSEEEMLREISCPQFFLPRSLYRDYPSHLHIDLLPRAQGKGMGTSMIKTILAVLKAKGSKGVHLEMSTSNKRALKFYLKRGFTVLDFDQDPQPPDNVLVLGREL